MVIGLLRLMLVVDLEDPRIEGHGEMECREDERKKVREVIEVSIMGIVHACIVLRIIYPCHDHEHFGSSFSLSCSIV